jgi:hypothetical protein
MPPARLREPAVPAKVKLAIEHMYSTHASLQATAEHVGLTTRKLRFLMTLPHVQRWLLLDKQARLSAITPANIAALEKIRDDDVNRMASVHAVKTLESMLDATVERTGVGRQAPTPRLPGLQIVVVQGDGTKQIVAGPAAPPLLEGTVTPVVPIPLRGGT